MPKKILIVDDEKLVTETLAGMLRRRGFEVLEVLDGNSALQFIQNQTPDLVVLDMKLPDIDGLEILKVLRKDYPNVLVIVVTGYSVEYKEKVERIGADGFFIKPILAIDLQDKIEELFIRGRQAITSSQTRQIPLKETVQQVPESIPEEGIIPRAKILLIEPTELLASMMQEYFSRRDLCEGDYEIKWMNTTTSLSHMDFLRYFQPDIILFDIVLVGLYGEFATALMNLPHPPKEIILFGDPATNWQDAATFQKGIVYVETPLDPDKFRLPHKDVLDRLNKYLKEACIKHGLYRIKGEKKKDG